MRVCEGVRGDGMVQEKKSSYNEGWDKLLVMKCDSHAWPNTGCEGVRV